ncbi:MAG: hypothetical protein ACXVC1_10305, partial [Tumebacillaceae bacterium]
QTNEMKAIARSLQSNDLQTIAKTLHTNRLQHTTQLVQTTEAHTATRTRLTETHMQLLRTHRTVTDRLESATTNPTALSATDALQVPLRPARGNVSWQESNTPLEFLKPPKKAVETKRETTTTPVQEVILPAKVEKTAPTAATLSPADLDRIVSKVYRELEEKLESEMKSRGF